MVKFRIETTINPQTQLVSASIYYPVNAHAPIAKTASIFSSHELAEKAVSEIIDEVFSSPQEPQYADHEHTASSGRDAEH